MLHALLDTHGYFFWLLVLSASVLVLERIRPWRTGQRLWRRQFGQDLCWLFFNGHYAGVLVAHLGAFAFSWAWPAMDDLTQWQLLALWPVWLQFVIFFIFRDLMEWGIHNLLHRTPALWEFHKVHHSIEAMDWIGNFRFHWVEIIVYQGITYLPLAMLCVDGRIILWIAIMTTLIGHLNHSNLNITWGPLRYVVNSPRMHIWHHSRDWPAGRSNGVNFGVSLSLWDWMFGTAWWPALAESPGQQPGRLGFPGIERFPRGIANRILHPLSRLWRGGKLPACS